MGFWSQQKILVTGSGGFLGSHMLEALAHRGCAEIITPRKKECDLTDPASVYQLVESHEPTLILHLAAICGGIGANQKEPGRYFFENAVMGLHLLEAARRSGVAKVVTIGTICAYPKFTPVPFHEDDLWAGYPEETNAPYGLAKKMLLVQSQAYRQQYGSNFVYLLPVNLYGPRDNFDLESSHVIPALIRKMETARLTHAPEVVLWGTGTASREFFFAGDCAEGIALAAEHYNSPEPVNLGSGYEITIRDLAEKIQAMIGYEGKIIWDSTKPDGQQRRQLDTSRAEQSFGFRAKVGLDAGLETTIAWYRKNYPQNSGQ